MLGLMTRIVPHRPHPLLAGDDLEYVRASYLPLTEIARREQVEPRQLGEWVEAGQLPRPAYLLPDGTPVFPPDLLDLVRSAGSVHALPEHFAQRTELAARLLGFGANTREADWEDYLSGEYGICLRQVTPETLVLKEALVERIDRALAFEVGGLDTLIRPVARVDRVRFGRPTSRERLVEAPRRRWEWLRARRVDVPVDPLISTTATPPT